MAPFEPRFGHAAEEFQRYRPNYPAALYDRILEHVPHERRLRALDLGSGTGKVAAHLLPFFPQVISVEPDAGMAAKIAERYPQIELRQVTAEECVETAESIDLVTIANALHWMEAERVLGNVRTWLRPEGILAVFGPPLPKTTLAVDAVTLAELRGPWKPHRDIRLKRDLIYEQTVRAAAGFEVIEVTKFPNIVPMSPRDYVGFWRSTSYGSAYARTLSEPESYWSNLESRFAEAAQGDMIPVDLSPTLIVARKS